MTFIQVEDHTAARADEPPVIEVSHLSKYYCRDLRRSLRYGVEDIGRELIGREARRSPELRPGEFKALDDVSFELRRGESLAVVGSNGAGKSTLLKMLYGLIKPDAGLVRIRGRTSALIELGTGFNPILSGRENITINAAIHGLSPAELHRVEDEIIAFAELEEAIDSPIRYYSSGMIARLAFAIAVQLRPDVLMVDEVLAVGDLEFQRKCVTRIRHFLGEGGCLIFISHNPHQVQYVCNRGMLLEEGRCIFTGTAVETVTRHLERQYIHRPQRVPRDGRQPDSSRPVVIEEVQVTPVEGTSARTGEPLAITISYRSSVDVEVIWGFGIWTGDRWVNVTGDYDTRGQVIGPGRGTLSCTIPHLPLLPGRYAVTAAISELSSLQPLALLGFEDAPISLIVRTDPSLRANSLVAQQQLVTLNVEWD